MAIEMTPEEIEEIFREYNEAVARGTPIEADLAERMKDASVGLRGYTQELKQNLQKIKSSTLSLVNALKDGQTGASVYNNTIESAADAVAAFLKPLGPIGKVIGTIVGAGGKLVSEVNKQTDALFKSYQDLNRFGAGITTGVEGVMQLSQQMGYTTGELSSFTSLLERNSQSLALMGGTVAQGTKQFADLVNTVGGQREMWRRLGLDVEQQNAAYAGYLKMMTLTGQSQRKTGAEMAHGSQEYLNNLLTLSKITGQSVEELQQQREARMADQRFASAQRDLMKKAADAERAGDHAAAARYRAQAEKNQELVDSVPQELKAGVQDLTTGYVGTSKAAMQIYRGMPEMANKIMSQQFETADVIDTGKKEAASRLDQFGKTLGGVGAYDETFGPLVGYVKLENQALAGSYEERKKLAEQEKEQQKALGGATASQAKLREQQLRTTQNLQSLVGVLSGPVTKGMSGLATVTGEASTALAKIAGVSDRGATPSSGPAPSSGTSGSSGTAGSAPAAPAPAPAEAPAAAPSSGSSATPTSAAPPATSAPQNKTETTKPTENSTKPARQAEPSRNEYKIANEPFTPGTPLSKKQMATIEFAIAQGNTYPAVVMDQYNKQRLASGNTTPAAPVEKPTEKIDNSNVNNPDTNNKTSTNPAEPAPATHGKALEKLADQAGIEKRAEGGPVDKLKPYLVGEKGAEIFVPEKNGKILANHKINPQTIQKSMSDIAGSFNSSFSAPYKGIIQQISVLNGAIEKQAMVYSDKKAFENAMELFKELDGMKIELDTQIKELKANKPKQQFAQGGIATGPESGYKAMLHGTEAVVPLAGGRTIPVEMPNFTSNLQGQMDVMGQQLSKLDELISETRINNTLTQKMLKASKEK